MKFLIAGFGSIGRRHFRNLLALGQREIIFYRSKRSTLPDDELAGYPVETDLAAALVHRPDAVIIATPTALHLDVAIPAAQQGCCLLLEKPISHNLARLDELQTAVAHGGAPVLVGFHYRFHPGLLRLRDLLAAGAIGRPVAANVQWGEYMPDWHPWEDYRQSYSARADLGGGVVLTLCHPLDYLRWLLGEVSAVQAFTATLGDLGLTVEDTAQIMLRFAGGPLGSVHLNYLQRPSTHRLEIVGTQGTLQWDNSDGVLRLYTPAEGRWQAYLPPAGFERNTLYLDMMRHFIAVTGRQEPPLCTLHDGVRALELAMGALGRNNG